MASPGIIELIQWGLDRIFAIEEIKVKALFYN